MTSSPVYPPWLRRKGGRQRLLSIEESAVCCPPQLQGRPVYNRLPGVNGGFQISPTTDPIVLVGNSGADFLNPNLSATGVLGFPTNVNIDISGFTLLFDALYPRVFDKTSIRFPSNVVNGYILADFFGAVYLLIDNVQPEFFECGMVSYTTYVLYEFSTDSSRITRIEDKRVFNNVNLPVAAWFTEYFDDLFQDAREKIEVFFDDYLNPTTVGHFSIPCGAYIRANNDVTEFRTKRDLFDHQYIREGLDTIEEGDLNIYAVISHGILDWLGQHYGIPWTPGYEIYAPPSPENKLYLTLGQKRALLRNAFNYDQVVTANGALYQYPFSNFPGQDLWSIATWKGINYAKGSIQVFNFVLDTLGLHGVAPRPPVASSTPPNDTTYYWNTEPSTWSESTQQWNLSSGSSTPGEIIISTPIEAYFTSSADDYITPLRPQVLYDCVVDGGLYPTYTYNLAIVGRTYTKTPGSAQAVYRVPLYWERNGKQWRQIEYALRHYATNTIIIGYQWFMPGISLPGDPIFNYDQCEILVESEPFINDSVYIDVDFYSTSVDVVQLFEPQFDYYILIQPPLDSPYSYQVVGTRIQIGGTGNHTGSRSVVPHTIQQVVKVEFTSKMSLLKYTRWVRLALET